MRTKNLLIRFQSRFLDLAVGRMRQRVAKKDDARPLVVGEGLGGECEKLGGVRRRAIRTQHDECGDDAHARAILRRCG
jgi:hypothetical protein